MAIIQSGLESPINTPQDTFQSRGLVTNPNTPTAKQQGLTQLAQGLNANAAQFNNLYQTESYNRNTDASLLTNLLSQKNSHSNALSNALSKEQASIDKETTKILNMTFDSSNNTNGEKLTSAITAIGSIDPSLANQFSKALASTPAGSKFNQLKQRIAGAYQQARIQQIKANPTYAQTEALASIEDNLRQQMITKLSNRILNNDNTFSGNTLFGKDKATEELNHNHQQLQELTNIPTANNNVVTNTNTALTTKNENKVPQKASNKQLQARTLTDGTVEVYKDGKWTTNTTDSEANNLVFIDKKPNKPLTKQTNKQSNTGLANQTLTDSNDTSFIKTFTNTFNQDNKATKPDNSNSTLDANTGTPTSLNKNINTKRSLLENITKANEEISRKQKEVELTKGQLEKLKSELQQKERSGISFNDRNRLTSMINKTSNKLINQSNYLAKLQSMVYKNKELAKDLTSDTYSNVSTAGSKISDKNAFSNADIVSNFSSEAIANFTSIMSNFNPKGLPTGKKVNVGVIVPKTKTDGTKTPVISLQASVDDLNEFRNIAKGIVTLSASEKGSDRALANKAIKESYKNLKEGKYTMKDIIIYLFSDKADNMQLSKSTFNFWDDKVTLPDGSVFELQKISK